VSDYASCGVVLTVEELRVGKRIERVVLGVEWSHWPTVWYRPREAGYPVPSWTVPRSEKYTLVRSPHGFSDVEYFEFWIEFGHG
jgi:hypothetical protein